MCLGKLILLCTEAQASLQLKLKVELSTYYNNLDSGVSQNGPIDWCIEIVYRCTQCTKLTPPNSKAVGNVWEVVWARTYMVDTL